MDTLHFLEISRESLSDSLIMQLKKHNSAILVINKTAQMPLKSIRTFCRNIRLNGLKQPVVLKAVYNNIDEESFILKSSTEVGGAFAEGIGNGIWLNYKQDNNANHLLNIIRLVNRTAFNILQASRSRISKTEYISCPSCGRTLFDLQETTAMIRGKTDHLKGVKIAIMGCIVNGPGEMADADYGYVGTGPGKITLYKGKEVVKRNIESKNALNELINLIKDDGYWIDKHAI
jgi:(E)-4-hydroxy-3-methylbut-2-enyl-diphosphate synthase